MLELHDEVLAMYLDLFIDLVLPLRGHSAFFGREREASEVVELHGLHELREFFELFVRLAGEARHDGGADDHVRHFFADLLYEVLEGLPVPGPMHAAKHRLVRVLQRDVEVVAHLRVGRHDVQQFIADAFGVAVEEADPLDAPHLGDGGQQFRQFVFLVQVPAVERGILGDEDDFLHALRREGLRLVDDVLDAPGAELAADLGNGTEGTVVGAAVADLQVGPVVRSREDAPAGQGQEFLVREGFHQVAAEDFVHDLHDVGVLTDADDRVDLRHLLADVILVALGQTACHDELLDVAGLLVLRHVEDVLDGLHLRRFNEAAGVDDDGVAPLDVSGDGEARPCQFIQHELGVDLVFRAAKADHSNGFLCSHRSSPFS